jgi:hypothetical protein
VSHEIKFGYITGQNLCFSAYQPDGSGRGIEQQPLSELSEGYYSGSPITSLAAGDEIVAYNLETVTWESEPIYIFVYGFVYWDGDIVSYEENWIYSYEDTDIVYEIVTSLGDVVGANEYTVPASDYASIITDLEDLIVGQQTINVNIDESGLTETGQPRSLASALVGFVETNMKEI